MAVKQPKSMLAGHTAGIFADMTLDGPEIGTLVAVVDRAKNLPNRKTMGKQDPYCAMRLGKEAKKTDTDRRGGQTPKWDQELRFTVHDSPDYYKLKVSVFNDDKKTDLIGEAYISLHELIKPGGGSNDLWHQLNYKGKYAGDIRMEMTYYDIRPREEKPVEKRKHREKTTSVASDAMSSVSGPRQLGPREVRRRPLPTSPAADIPNPSSTPQSQAPPPPPKIPITQPSQGYVPTPYVEQYPIDSQDYSEIQAQPQNNYHQSSIQQHYQPEPQYQELNPESHYDQMPDQLESSSHSPRSLQLLTQYSPSYHEISDPWDESGRRHSEKYEPSNSIISPYDSPPPLPHASHSAPEVPQYHPHRTSTSPTKAIQYRDSPLRHSINQQEVLQDVSQEPESYDTPPPPPPKHRDSGARRLQTDYSSSAFAPKPLRPTPRRPSIDERSPLQNIERDFDPSLVLVHNPSRHSSYDIYTQPTTDNIHTPDRHGSYDAYSQPSPLVPRANSGHGSFDPYSEVDSLANRAPEVQPYYDPQQERSMVLKQQYTMNDHIDVYGRRNSRNAFVQEQQNSPTLYQNGHPGSYDDHQAQNTRPASDPYSLSTHPRPQTNIPEHHSTPVPVRPRVQKTIPTQAPGYTPTRKAVSPGPYPVDTSRRLSETPFGPDDYDVLNPASSPATNEHTVYETSEQSKESARLREVEKLRDQGPIIGNDGRVIDPSDHLPSDTWAPEPERKQRKPEHVIHIRTKNDTRGHTPPASSPASIRMNMHRNPAPNSPSSVSPSSAPPSTGRNRLQKPMPTRPLPAQPYQQPHPTPNNPVESPTKQSQKRNSYHDMSPGIERPSLSEYQVPVSNSYSPRGNTYQISNNHQPTPPRMPYVEDYSPSRFSDPLAAEMSMIDIGPSRGARTALRPSRGY